MDRVLQGTGTTVSVTFYEDGVIVDPGSVTLNVTRADGTVLVASGTASGSGATARTFALTATHTGLLDRLTLAWVSASKGTLTTTVEIVGGFLFSLAQARATSPLNDVDDYPTGDLLEMRTTVESAMEELCGAFVPRYARDTVQARYGRPLRLPRPFVRAVRSVTINGIDLSPSEVAAVMTDGSFLYGSPWGTGSVTVGYEHGRDRPPERIRRAALLLAKVWLVSGPVDDRTNTFTSTEGGTYSLVTPGRGGSVFGVPEVDTAVSQHAITLVG